MISTPETQNRQAPPGGAPRPRAVSLRALLIGLALIPPNIIWVVMMERVDGRAFSTTISLFFTAAFSLFALAVANRVVRRCRPAWALSQGELLTIFSMLSLATAMAGVDFGSPLITLMGHGFQFATPENRWESLFSQYLPRWLTVSDREALYGYYAGNATLYRWSVLRAWLVPIGAWTLLILVLLWVMACLNTLVRVQWTERERLTYPVIQLPVAVAAEDGGLFRSRLFWAGFVLAGSLSLTNGLHLLIPTVPSFTFNGYDAQQWFRSRPWNAIGWTPLALFPFIIGLGYLLPTDLLFSCWFFFLFWRGEKVVASALGYLAERPKVPYVNEQMFGAYVAICILALWSMRGHLKAAWRAACSGAAVQDADEPLPYRVAVFGAAGGFLFLVGFAWLAGLPVWLGVAFFALYFVIALAVTRMRAELGPPTHDLHFIGPDQSLVAMIGVRGLSGSALGVFTLFFWFNRAYRCHPMPHQLEGFRMAQITRTSARGLLGAMMLASLVGIVATFWTTLHVSYHLGAAGRIHGWSSLGFGNEAYNRLATWISSPPEFDIGQVYGMGVGFLLATALATARVTVYGWPFHALGFAISGGWSMMWAWLSLFVAWLLKGSILRFGGLRAYRAGLPFFFGVILGDFVVGGTWTLLGLVFDMPIHSLWNG